MSTTYTPNAKLAMPAIGDTGWAVPVNANSTLLDALSPVGSLAVTTKEVPSASLNVTVAAGTYIKQDGTVGTFAGPTSQAIGASATQVLYLDLTKSGMLAIAAAYPSTPHVRLATVVTGATTISSITDNRQCFNVVGSWADGVNITLGSETGTQLGTRRRRNWGSSARRPRYSPPWAPRPPERLTRATSRPCFRPYTVPFVRWDWGVEMPGSFDLDNTTPPLYGDVLAAGVYLYTPGEDDSYFLFPNVRCLRIDYREGPEPPVARFEYIMDNAIAVNLGWPSQFEELWPIDAQGPYVVNPDDRLVVMAQNPDGDPDAPLRWIRASAPGGRDDAGTAGLVHSGRRGGEGVGQPGQRPSPAHADPVGLQDTSGDSDVQIDLPCRFNPSDTSGGSRGGYLPNRTPDNEDTVQSLGEISLDHPVFLDPGIERSPDPRAYWSISDAIKYLLAEYNGSQTYTSYPTLDALDDLLQVESPPSGEATFDPANAEASPLTIRDYDASNRPYPEVIAELLSYAGFVMRWDTGADENDLPSTQLRIYRRDGAATSPLKSVYLDAAGAPTLDPSRNNLARLHLARDGNSIVNAWQVETNQRLVEISIILAPLYQPSTSDANPPTANSSSAPLGARRRPRRPGEVSMVRGR